MLIIVFLLNLITSYILLSYFYKSKMTNFYDIPSHRSLHLFKKKRIGGLSLFLLILMNFIFFYLLYYPFTTFENLLFVSIIFFINLINDRYSINSIIRLILFFSLYYVMLSFNLENDITPKSSILALTIFFLTTSISTNFNDGSDFYISLIYLFLIVGLLIFNSLFLHKYKIYFLSVIFISFLSIFFFFNFYPSKVFLGDSGAYLLSLFPFLVFIISDFNLNIILISFHFLSPIIIDSLLTLYLRLKNKKNIFKPHLEHFFQRIVIKNGHIFLIKISFFLYIINLIVYICYSLINSNFFMLPIFSLLSYIIYRILIKKYVFRA